MTYQRAVNALVCVLQCLSSHHDSCTHFKMSFEGTLNYFLGVLPLKVYMLDLGVGDIDKKVTP